VPHGVARTEELVRPEDEGHEHGGGYESDPVDLDCPPELDLPERGTDLEDQRLHPGLLGGDRVADVAQEGIGL
jgi:hypothetical protein